MVGADAYYVNIKLGSFEVVALIHTGAMVTTLSTEVFDRCAHLKPFILSHVMGIWDRLMDILGKIHMPLDLGPVSSESQWIVITECDGDCFHSCSDWIFWMPMASR